MVGIHAIGGLAGVGKTAFVVHAAHRLAGPFPAGQVPPGLEARMALWRDRLAGLQLRLILDHAVGSEQVLPLLPGSGGSLVLVTSRRHLSALDDAAVISLDTAADVMSELLKAVG